jgi:hypothetical protein
MTEMDYQTALAIYNIAKSTAFVTLEEAEAAFSVIISDLVGAGMNFATHIAAHIANLFA